MFFVLQLWVKFGISPRYKLWTNLVSQLCKCVDLDMSKWANPAHTGWLTTSRVQNEWTQPGSLFGEPEIL